LRRNSSAAWWWLLAGVCAGCTTLAGIDGEYVPITGELGGTENTGGAGGAAGSGGSGGVSGFGGSGGSSAAGGSSGTAGAQGSAGTIGSGGTGNADGTGGTGSGCPANQKRCGTECVTTSVENGCSAEVCDACPAVLHGLPICNATNDCSFRCDDHYVVEDKGCVPESTGGSGGSGGTSGSSGTGSTGGTGGTGGTDGSGGSGGTGGGTCHPTTCAPCTALDGKIPCCTRSGQCGCMYPFVGAFFCP